ncbi:hypothetical protein PsorP6_005288 [Peronosclerospora sorghi]|uniref:Uncharacterized protein n=1 Tax=Peronosclerospora sorghi TaxID=230839 RepID=A0ACC0W1V6_9STRA|nr:hypothetical protein PsorP6_005288 [Peronosclerospora sorghi]
MRNKPVSCKATSLHAISHWSNPFAVSEEDSGAYGLAPSYPYCNSFMITRNAARFSSGACEFAISIPDMQVTDRTDLSVTVHRRV